MTQVYFHCTNAKKVLVDHYGAVWTISLRRVITRPRSCNPSLQRAVPKIGAIGSCTSMTTSAKSSSLSPSLLCSASRISARGAFIRIASRACYRARTSRLASKPHIRASNTWSPANVAGEAQNENPVAGQAACSEYIESSESGFWKSLAWSIPVLAGVLYLADPFKPISSDALPIWFLAADFAASGSFAEITPNEVRSRRDGSAADDAGGARLFGMETDPVPEGALSDKWRRVEVEIAKDLEIIARCQAGNPCPAPAQALIDLSLQGAGRSGRALVGVINRAVNLAISPASDEKRWGVQDHWSDPFETLHFNSGDCEDFAFVKYAALLAAGFSKDAVKIVVLRNRWPDEEHAVVAVRVGHQWLILDNRTLTLVRDTDVVRAVPEFVLDDRGVRRFAGAIDIEKQ